MIDVVAETTPGDGEALLLSGDLPPTGKATRKKPPSGSPRPGEEQLPHHCQGLACLARSMLVQMMEQCGNDRECWRSALARIKGEEQLPGKISATPPSNLATNQ